jgi:TolA-binding protein
MPRSSLKGFANGHRLLMALCVSLLVTPLSAQETVDPALQLYYSANAVYNRKQYPLAIPIYNDFLSKHDKHEKSQLARYGLGMCQFALKKYDQALPQFEALLKEKNLDGKISRDRLLLLHAQCLLFTNQQDEALERLLASADTFKPGVYRTGVLAAISDLYFSKSDWPNTLAWAKQLREANPSPAQSIRAGYQEGYALYKLSKLPEAIAILDETKAQAVAAKDEAWATRIGQLLGECHISNQDLDKAEAFLQATLPNLQGQAAVDTRYRLAAIKYTQKQWPESQADYENFLDATKDQKAADPRNREARFRVARCLMEQGEFAKARTAFQTLTEEDDEIAAQAILWQGRVFSRDPDLPQRHEKSAAVLQQAVAKPWYKTGFPNSQQTIVADIDFEHANALMLQTSPNWEVAHKLLLRVQQRRGDYRHMAEVLSQQAICLHKLGDFPGSAKATTAFLQRYPEDALAGDMRFLHAENLFLMKKQKEAEAAFREFAITHKQHDKRWAAVFRIAQILHYQEQWEESNKIAVPLLEKDLKGDLFSPLAFVVGENYFRLGKWSEAIAPFEAFLASHSKPQQDPQLSADVQQGPYVDAALLQLGIACSRIGKKQDALRYLELLEKTYSTETPHLPLALAEQGKLYYELEKLEQARKSLETFLKYRGDQQLQLFNSNAATELGRVYYYLGWIDAAAERYAEAAVNFGLAVANDRGRRGNDGSALEADALLQQGIALVNAEDFAQAATHLQSLAQKYKNHPQIGLVKYYAGLAYARSKKWPAAASYFQQVLKDHSDAPFADKALYEWAWCEREQKRTAQATEQYELLLAKYPKSTLVSKVQSELADLNLDMGAQEAVIARLTETIKTVQDAKLKFELRYQLASAYFKTKNFEKSAPLFEALIPDGKQSELLPSILFQAGESRLALTETVPARDHYQAASQIEKVPASLAESILLRLGETQNITGQHQQAQASYQQFLTQYRESQWTRNAQYGLAFAMEKQQDYENAIGEYAKLLPTGANRAVKMDKWLVQGRYQMGECYFNLQQYDKAIVEFASVDASAGGYPEWQAKAVLEMGRVYLSQGQKTDAADRMKEVLQRFPNSKAAGVAQKYLDEIRSGD